MPERPPLDTEQLSDSIGDAVETAGVQGSSATAWSALPGALSDPVVAILLLAGLFEVFGNPPHSVVLVGTAVALVWTRVMEHTRGLAEVVPGGSAGEAAGPPAPAARVAVYRSAWWWGGVAAIASFALLVGALERFSWPMTWAVLVPVVGGLALAWLVRRPSPAPPPLERVGARAWIAVFVAMGLWELANLAMQPSLTTGSWDHPTLSVLADPLLASHGGRSVGLFGWLALGWYLVKR